MSILENPKLKFLLIIPIILGIVYFATTASDFDILNLFDQRAWVLEQFVINYESMMNACSEDDLTPKELESCLDAFEEVREFCAMESDAEPCGDENMEELEQKLLDK